MPLFDYLCQDCNKPSEILLVTVGDVPSCNDCGSRNLKNCFLPILNIRDSRLQTTRGRKIQPAAALPLNMPDVPVREAAAESDEKELAG